MKKENMMAFERALSEVVITSILTETQAFTVSEEGSYTSPTTAVLYLMFLRGAEHAMSKCLIKAD